MTEIQRRCIEAIRRLTVDGVSPTYEELTVELGFASRCSIARLVKVLAAQGLITYGRTPRSIKIVGDPYDREALATLSSGRLGEVHEAALSILIERARVAA